MSKFKKKKKKRQFSLDFSKIQVFVENQTILTLVSIWRVNTCKHLSTWRNE